ncbi:FAD:protein FMN transferase [Rhodoferax sp. WC2427]|uniref:FAD:protein FMN transferase n=1 Tax=Rhodoferax sp. WC2427 TaxID=3234144 RepID=UPI0034679395
MKRRTFVQAAIGLSGMGLSHARQQDGLLWRERTLTGLGTTMAIRVGHSDAALAEQALDAARDTIRHVEDQMSLYRSDSAICQLNRTGRLHHPHPDLVRILQVAQTVSARSHGAFDVTVQPLWTAFQTASQQSRLPTPDEVRQAQNLANWKLLDISQDAITLGRKGMGITLNGIAQGFAADLVVARLQALGIRHALIDTGEWAALGTPVPHRGWTLGVADPRDARGVLARVAMDGRCVATSADNQCSFSPDFQHHHIFDPATGYSPAGLSCVAVLAPSCVLADALTKVMFVAGFKQSLQLAKVWNVDVLVVDKKGVWQATPGVTLLPA